jgi:hypothetical protein
MANIRVATAVRNDMLAALLARMNLGAGPATLKMYSGTQPANGDAAEAGTLLGTLTFSDPAAAAPASGTLTFSAITEDSEANATAICTWARIEDSDGNNVFDGNVGETDAMIVLNTTDIKAGGPIRVTSFSITLPVSITF